MSPDDEIPGGIQKHPRLVHVGFDAQRVVYAQEGMDRLEQVLAFRWMEANHEEWCLLDRLIYCPPESKRGANQRDAKVAATVVQWLGTAVGYAFLERCLNEAGFRIEPPR